MKPRRPITLRMTHAAFLGFVSVAGSPFLASSPPECTTQVMGGLVAYWSFDEVDGSILVDLSENGHDGQIGSTTTRGEPGVVCNAYRFDGSLTDTVAVEQDPDFQFQGEFAVSGWLKLNSFPPDNPFDCYKPIGQRQGNEWGVRICPPSASVGNPTLNQLEFGYEHGPDVNEDIGYELGDSLLGEWHYFIAQYNGGVGRQELYFDGELVASRSAPAPEINFTTEMGIGGETTYSPRVMIGSLDEFRVFDRALSLTEIETLSNCRDEDGDGFSPPGDCNDADPLIGPGEVELPGNFVDEDCDGDLGSCDPCFAWRNHGEYVRCIAHIVEGLVASGSLNEEDGDALVASAAQSNIGKRGHTPPECP